MAGHVIALLLLVMQAQAAVVPPSPPIAGQWSIVAIGQEPVAGPQYMLSIGAAEIGGRTGCNSFSAPYAAAGDVLTVGAARTTRLACAPSVMSREQRALAILSGAVRIGRPDASTLVLSGDEGAIRLRRAQ